LSVSFINESSSTTKKDAPKLPSDNWFSLKPGLNFGAEYKFQKIALYSGFGLTLFNWNTYGRSGGDKDHKEDKSEWEFIGISWDQQKLTTAGALGFGITFTPIENLVIGGGLSIGNRPTINLATMQLTTSPSITSAPTSFTLTNFNVTISYKFQSAAKEPSEPRARQNAAEAADAAEKMMNEEFADE
jgi:hypothetical protein